MDMIRLEDCKHGYTYLIHSRNLTVGVFDSGKKGFVGIREKFNSKFLFVELHRDTGAPYGTVSPKKEIEKCPIDDIREDLGGVCSVCDKEVDWKKTDFVKHTGVWFHVGDQSGICKDGSPTTKKNDRLYAYLKPVTERAEIAELVREIENCSDPNARPYNSRHWLRQADSYKLAKVEEYCEAAKVDKKTARDWITGNTIVPDEKIDAVCSFIVKKAKERLS